MYDPLKDEERKVIPRWRRLSDTPRREIMSVDQKLLQPLDITPEFAETLRSFELEPTHVNAVELVQLADFVSDRKAIHDAAHLLIEDPRTTALVRSKASKVMSGGAGQPSSSSPEIPSRAIAYLRGSLRKNPRNALAHVELARSYASLGIHDKAYNHFRVAIQCAPTNRFVLRAAGRFFVHMNDEEKAWRAMKEAAKYDPWVAASRFSIADLAKLPRPKSKEVEAMIERIGDPTQTSELSAALATAELEAGNVKRAKRLLRDSAVAPTDNVVAQLEWISKTHGLAFDERLLTQDLAFEARAAHHVRSEAWEAVIGDFENWLDDEPFSLRPAAAGSFYAAEILMDYGKAQEFAFRGLVANPLDPTLLNNLAFFQAATGDLEKASRTLSQAKRSAEDAGEKIAVVATEGLIYYRQGNRDAGAQLYERAIEMAHAGKETASAQLAFLHYAVEEVRAGASFGQEEMAKIKELFSSPKVNKVVSAIFRAQLEPTFIDADRKHAGIAAAKAVFDQVFNQTLIAR